MFLIGHGISVRADLPIPEWLFGWAAAMVLVVSFVALAVLLPEPRLQRRTWRPLPGRIGRFLAIRPVELVCGAIGVFLLGVVIYSGLRGVDVPEANFASMFVYVAFWVGLVPLSVLFGDVFRGLTPGRAIGRAAAGVAQKASRSALPAPLESPQRLGRWPAAIGLFAFTALELVYADGDKPESVAIAALVYSALTFIGMALYGVERWIERGEAFSVYFNLFSRLSPVETRDRKVGLRRPLSGLPSLELLPGTIAVLAVMIGTVTFDGASEAPLWSGISPDIASFFQDVGLSPQRAFELAFLVGLTGAVLLVGAFYRLGILGAKSVGGGVSASRLAHQFAHSLVPVPLGHVAALILAHDKALALYEDAKQAVRSQYWMLAIMVGFPSLALWLLSQANA